MSKQAFEKLMTQLPHEDKKNIYAVAAAYGLDFEAPEWIPFAVSQHGLLSIQRAIVDLNTAVTEGSNFAIGQAMKALTAAKEAELVKLQAATTASQKTVKDAAEIARSAIDAQSAVTQSALMKDVVTTVNRMVDDTFNRQAHRIDAIQRSLVDSLNSAEERIGQIRHTGTLQVLAWAFLGSVLGGALVATFMCWMINHGHVQQPQAKINLDGNAVGQYIVSAMRRK